MLIGYARVSKADGSQSLDLQRDALRAASVDDAVNLYHDFASGVRDDRPGLDSCLRARRKGDVFVVWKLDRLGRNLAHLVNTVQDLSARGVGLRVLTGEGAQVGHHHRGRPPGLRRDLKHLLEETVDAGMTRFVWLRQFEPGSNSADANRLLDRLEHLRGLDVPEGPLPRYPSAPDHAVAPAGGALLRRRTPRAPGQPPPRDSRGLRRRVGVCSSPTRSWRPTTGSSAERIAKPLGPAKCSSETSRPRSASRSGHSPSWGGR